MRIFVRNQIIELIPTICEGIKYVKNDVSNEVSIVLADCIEAIISINKSLESGLSEQRFSFYNDLMNNVKQGLDELKSGLDDNNKVIDGLMEIASLLKNEEEVKIEIVFLPYKASMWDSMDSVWKASQADSRCLSYVVPIPYYEQSENGGFNELHYEGADIPNYVPVMHYESYSLEKHRPDIVYVHNPFDNYNRVTSVEPRFYSNELKKYAGMLVYIPYFATGGALSKTFYELPFYYNMDYIITQSSNMKEFYAGALSNKLLPLGTPKFDYIVNYEVDRKEVLQKWNIENYDKVFFYNTSISALLTYREQIIKKIQYVIDTFEKLDYALIWRPHPLMRATLKSMIPGLLHEYEKVITKARNCKNIVVDESADANVAIKVSDAYIGEETSSIVHLFGVEGKPIFLTNEMIVQSYDDETNNTRIFDAIKVDGYFWAVSGDRNCLFKYDENGEILETYEIPNEKKDANRLYNSIIHMNNKLYLVPYLAKEIAIFDLVSKKFEKVKFENPQTVNFINAYVYSDSIYFVPAQYNSVLQLNIKDNKVVYHKQIVVDMLKLKKDEKEVISFNGNLIKDNLLYIAMASSNHVFVMNLDTGKYEDVLVGESDCDYWCMAGNNDKFVLGTNTGNKLVIWDKIKNETRVLKDFPTGWTGSDKCFYKMVNVGNNVLVFPKSGNMILNIDLTTETVSKADLNLLHQPSERKNGYYIWPSNYLMVTKLSEEEIAVQSAYAYGMEIININGDCRRVDLQITDEKMPYNMDSIFIRRSANIPFAMRETCIYTVGKFVDYVANGNFDKEKAKAAYADVAANIDGNAGLEIHKAIMSKME